MFFKARIYYYFQRNFCKWYIVRISAAFSRRLIRDQFSLIWRNRRNLIFAASLVGVSVRTSGTLEEEFKGVKREYLHNDPFSAPDPKEDWEQVWSDEHIRVFRRRFKGRNHIYEYRCIGTYMDISPNDFMAAQRDIEYRLKWDKNVKSLDVLEDDQNTGEQLIRWESKYPYPLQPRLYIFLRRQFIDHSRNQITVLCRALNEEAYPDSSQTTVRVNDYESTLIVRAHTKFEECGLDFLLAYHDDTRAPLPRKIYEFGVNVIGPNFLEDVHKAALQLAKMREDRK